MGNCKNNEYDQRIIELSGFSFTDEVNDDYEMYKKAAKNLYSKKLLKPKKKDYSEFENDIIKICKNMNKDINDVITYIKKQIWPNYEDFEYETNLSKSVLNKHITGTQKSFTKKTLLTVCVSLGFHLSVIDIVLEKAGYSLSRFDKRDLFCRKILIYLPEISLMDFDKLLYCKNFEPNSYKKNELKYYLKKHDLKKHDFFA